MCRHPNSLDFSRIMTVYADLVRYRELFSNLFRRDFQAKYKGSVLGVLWSLLNPLFLLAGLSCWIFFATSLQSAARSVIDPAELVKKVRFPRQLVAFSMVATQA